MKFISFKIYSFLSCLSAVLIAPITSFATNSSDVHPAVTVELPQGAYIAETSSNDFEGGGSGGTFYTQSVCPLSYQPRIKLSIDGVNTNGCMSGADDVVAAFSLNVTSISNVGERYLVSYKDYKKCMFKGGSHSGLYFSYALYCFPPKQQTVSDQES